MNEDEDLYIQIYSSRKLENSSNFSIKTNPYENADARETLKNLGVVFYRDNKNSRGIILDESINLPMNGFYSLGMLDEDTFEITEFDEGPMEGQDSWMMLNKEVLIIAINEMGVTRK